jgi:hypothetical protein
MSSVDLRYGSIFLISHRTIHSSAEEFAVLQNRAQCLHSQCVDLADCHLSSGWSQRGGLPGGVARESPRGVCEPGGVVAVDLCSGLALSDLAPVLCHGSALGVSIPQKNQQITSAQRENCGTIRESLSIHSTSRGVRSLWSRRILCVGSSKLKFATPTPLRAWVKISVARGNASLGRTRFVCSWQRLARYGSSTKSSTARRSRCAAIGRGTDRRWLPDNLTWCGLVVRLCKKLEFFP